MFPVYEDFDKRPEGVTQETIVADLRRRLSRHPGGGDRRPGPAGHSGPGSGRRIPDDGRDQASLGLAELQKVDARTGRGRRTRSPTCAASSPPSARNSPQYFLDIDRTQALIARGAAERRVPDPADLPRIDLRQPVQQVQPELPGPRTGRLPSSGRDTRTSATSTSPTSRGRSSRSARSLNVTPTLGCGTGHPLQSLSGGDRIRCRRARLQLRAGPRA